jgi:hypothetical protein
LIFERFFAIVASMTTLKVLMTVVLMSLNVYALNFQENDANAPVDGSAASVVRPPHMDEPADDYQMSRSYSHVDPNHLISAKHLQRALAFFDYNYNNIPNKRYMSVIDFSLNASTRRFFLIDMQSGEVQPMLTAVGVGSDPDGDGMATMFSNVAGSRMSSLGYYLTAEEYKGGNGRSLRLHGLSDSNNNAFDRLIVIHGAAYVSEQGNHAGRSYGCPAVDQKLIDDVINKTENGSLMYIGFRD